MNVFVLAGRVAVQTPRPSATDAAIAAAAASGAVQFRRRCGNEVTFSRSLRACVRIRSRSSGGGAGPTAP